MIETEIKASEIPEGSEGYWERSGGNRERHTMRQAERSAAALAWIPGGGGDSEVLGKTSRPTFKTSLQFPQTSNLVAYVDETVIPLGRWKRDSTFVMQLLGPFTVNN